MRGPEEGGVESRYLIWGPWGRVYLVHFMRKFTSCPLWIVEGVEMRLYLVYQIWVYTYEVSGDYRVEERCGNMGFALCGYSCGVIRVLASFLTRLVSRIYRPFSKYCPSLSMFPGAGSANTSSF